MIQQRTDLMTAEDLERLPANGMRHELVRGELRTMPPAGGEHGYFGVNLTLPMGNHAKANKLGIVLGAETGFKLATNPDTVRAPDVAFIRKARIPPTGIPRGYWPGAPDVAVEVVSPSDTVDEVEEKVQEWLAAGTALVWIVYPRSRTVAVHRSPTDVTILSEKDELDGETVMPGFRFPVREVFG